MKPRDRVLLAIEHKVPDRIPVDWWATFETVEKMCNYLSTTPEGVVEKLKIDLRYIGLKMKNSCFEKQKDGSFQKHIGGGIFEDVWGVKRKKIDTGRCEYFELVSCPFENIEDARIIEKAPLPDTRDFEIENIDADIASEYAMVFTGDRLSMRTSFFKLAMYLRGFENFLVDLITNEVMAKTIINRLFEFHYELTGRIFDKYSGSIDIFLMGDDFGTQNGPLIGLETFRHYFKEPIKKMVELCHRYKIKAMLHSCGSIKIFIPDLIDTGIDILNPVQHTALDMDISSLKKEFGNYICFHGGIDVQNILPFGSEKQIRDEVIRCIEVLGSNGGYICAPTHNIQADVSPEKIIAMYLSATGTRT